MSVQFQMLLAFGFGYWWCKFVDWMLPPKVDPALNVGFGLLCAMMVMHG
jgi:hypothetical protein